LPDEPIRARLRWTSRVGGLSTVLNTDSLPLCVNLAPFFGFKSILAKEFYSKIELLSYVARLD